MTVPLNAPFTIGFSLGQAGQGGGSAVLTDDPIDNADYTLIGTTYATLSFSVEPFYVPPPPRSGFTYTLNSVQAHIIDNAWTPTDDGMDDDGDEHMDIVDNCPTLSNPEQIDSDNDLIGDVCDNCPFVHNPEQEDTDNDGAADACDNCPLTTNGLQEDADGDLVGNVCDNCPLSTNGLQEDTDTDGVGDACDNCPAGFNPGQEDTDSDGIGNVCEVVAQWTNAGGGSWSIGSNWSTGLSPLSGENVVIDLSGTYTVTMDQNVTISSLVLGGTSGTQTLNMNGKTLALGSSSTVRSRGVLMVSGTLTGPGDLLIEGSANSGEVAWSMSGSGITRIAPGAIFTIPFTFTEHNLNRRFENDGTVNWMSRWIRMNGGTIVNRGVLHAQPPGFTDQYIYVEGIGNAFFNEGLLVYTMSASRTSGYYPAGANATFINADGGTVQINGGTLDLHWPVTNDGNFIVSYGTLKVYSALTGFADSTLTGGSYDVSGVFRFAGANIVTNGAEIILRGPSSAIQDTSGADALANFATNAAAGSFTLEAGRNFGRPAATFTNLGSLNVGSDCTFDVATLDVSGGVLGGDGTVNANVNNTGGIVAAGLSPGQLDIIGDYTQSAGGTFAGEIAGTTPSTEYDVVTVSGTASLDGDLNVAVVGGFEPQSGNAFDVLTAGSVSGTFANVAVNGLPAGVSMTAEYGPTTVSLATSAGVPAATVTGVVSRKACDLPIASFNGAGPRGSEPRQGGITELRITFDVAPAGPGANPVTIEQATCAAPEYAAYSGASSVNASIAGSELVLTFAPGLENARSYRVTMGASVTGAPEQYVEIRGLIGDVNSDGLVNGTDRSVVVGAWTGSGVTCATDINSSGQTNATDRSIVVGAWTGAQNCAP